MRGKAVCGICLCPYGEDKTCGCPPASPILGSEDNLTEAQSAIVRQLSVVKKTEDPLDRPANFIADLKDLIRKHDKLTALEAISGLEIVKIELALGLQSDD